MLPRRNKDQRKKTLRQAERSKSLRLLTFAAQTIAFAAVSLVTTMWWLFPIAIVILGVGHWYAYRFHAQDKRIRAMRIGAFVGLHAALLYLLMGIFGGLPYPQAQFAVLASAIVSFELYSRLNLFSAFGMGLVNLYVAATLSRDITFGAFLLGFVGCWLAFMWVADSEDGLKNSDAVLRPTLTAEKSARHGIRRSGTLRIGQLAVVGALCMGLIFVVTPRFVGRPIFMPISLQTPIRAQPSSQIINPAIPLIQFVGMSDNTDSRSEYYYGFANSLDLSYRGGLSDTIMMYVSSPAWSYWRGYAYDHFDGIRWSQSVTELRTVASPRYGRGQFILNAHPSGETFVQSFYVVQDMPNILWAGGNPASVYFAAEEIALDSTGGIRVGEALQRGTVYSVISEAQQHDPDILRGANRDLFREMPLGASYLQLPDTTTQRVRDLAEEIAGNLPTVYDQVVTVRDYLMTNYPYDLFPPPQAPNTDAVDQFLFVDQRGVCEHYVSAMIIMLRSLGIPSRFVVGYGSGDFNPITNFYEVRANHAHAWVEVFFPNQGWVSFDPTPGWESAPQTGGVQRWALSELFSGFDLSQIPIGGAISTGMAVISGLMPIVVIIGGAVALIFAILRLVRWWNKRKHIRPIGLNDPARRAIFAEYHRAQRKLKRSERRSPAQTPREHALKHQGKMSQLAELSELVEVAAYRPQPPDKSLILRARQWRRRSN